MQRLRQDETPRGLAVWPRDLSQHHSRHNLSYLRLRRPSAPAVSCWIYGSPSRQMDQSRSSLSTTPILPHSLLLCTGSQQPQQETA